MSIHIQRCSPSKSLHILAETVRFELTDLLQSTVFKTVAINRALPHFLNLGCWMGFEPTTTGITIRDSTAELPTPLVRRAGIEPTF